MYVGEHVVMYVIVYELFMYMSMCVCLYVWFEHEHNIQRADI